MRPSCLSVFSNDKKLFTQQVKYEPSCVSIHPGQIEIAVGDSQEQNVYIYNLEGDTLKESDKLSCKGAITQVAYSPDGANLGVGDAGRYVHVFNTTDRKVVHQGWSFHTARVNCLAWSPDSRHMASGSLDTNIIIWSMENPNKRIVIKGAHKMSQITSLAWLNDNTVVSTGQDSCIKQWTLTLH
ncbi:actin-interacting protein 1-like [Saccoglossus kowalevskii]|uniref:Actin-interacting protein 1-like n=1 Tax=Saccoglossus kowalevskii TaxID=10224 RepID=A0ABM0MIG8_SACKO|nr:PREDICTED: actin-interacting protein 1-like [Saccoglossus kowalevskii]